MYVNGKFGEFSASQGVKTLCYISSIFGAANFEEQFLRIPYFYEETIELEVDKHHSEVNDAEAEPEEDDDGFVFDDFENVVS